MSSQLWDRLPEHVKRAAAPDLLVGRDWYWDGETLISPGEVELRKWAMDEQPQLPPAANLGEPLARQTRVAVSILPKPRRPGRPSIRSRALEEAICQRIASGESLRAVCRDPAMPSKSTVLRWLSKDADRARKPRISEAFEAEGVLQ